jgi:hypothetical protein
MRIFRFVAAALGAVSVLAGGAVWAQGTESPAPEEIMRRLQQAFFYTGQDFAAKVGMRLVDKGGRERRRSLTMLRLNAKEGRQKYYTYFHAPADVRGTAFLVWKYPDKDDDRWLFIPAIKLVTRIAAKDNQSSFVGSDFTYEDVSGRDLGADAYKLLREEAVSGRDCYVVESNPKTASAFSRKVSWVDKTSFLPVKEEYYDVQNDLFRVFTADEIKEIEGHPTAVRRTVKNLKTGHYTEVVFENVDYDAGLEEGLFSERSLQSPPARWIQ